MKVRGFGLVETLVGVAIALVTIALVYRAVVAGDATRQRLVQTADLDDTGQFVLAQLAFDIAQAGAGFAPSTPLLDRCPYEADSARTPRPVSVLITDGGSAAASDSIIVRGGHAPALATALPVTAAAARDAPLPLEGPPRVAPGDRIVVADRSGLCAATEVGTVAPDPGGSVVTHDGLPFDVPVSAAVVDLGPADKVTALRYDVVDRTLRSTDLLSGAPANPLASNIALLKLRYGVDRDGDGIVDAWTAAVDDAAVGRYTPDALLRAPAAVLQSIRAVRIGLVVRSEFPDRTIVAATSWTLFDCAPGTVGACPGRLTGSFAATAAGGYRYRTFEATVPLRNVLWSPG